MRTCWNCGATVAPEHDLSRCGATHWDLQAIASDLHMAYTGAADPLDPVDEAHKIAVLQARLSHWNESPPRSVLYDNAVREVLHATLTERLGGCRDEVSVC